MVGGADHGHALVGHFVAIADRAIAQQPAAERFGVELVVHPFRPVVDHAGRQQDGARAEVLVVAAHDEMVAIAPQVGHAAGFAQRAVASRLVAHAFEQFVAVDPVGKTRMIVAGGDPARPARTAIEHADRKVIARQIDRGGQPGGPRTHDDAVVLGWVHGPLILVVCV